MPDSEETLATEMADLKACPHCGENLVGDEIAPSQREFFGERTHFSKLIGISNGDSVMYYECPKCGGRVERGPGNTVGGAYRTCDVEIR